MFYLKSFESMFKVSREELIKVWETYLCNNCGSVFHVIKPKEMKCKLCFSKDVIMKFKTEEY